MLSSEERVRLGCGCGLEGKNRMASVAASCTIGLMCYSGMGEELPMDRWWERYRKGSGGWGIDWGSGRVLLVCKMTERLRGSKVERAACCSCPSFRFRVANLELVPRVEKLRRPDLPYDYHLASTGEPESEPTRLEGYKTQQKHQTTSLRSHQVGSHLKLDSTFNMSDSEHDSRAMAVGRKRNKPGKSYNNSLESITAGRADGSVGSGSSGSASMETTSRRSSLESGEIASSSPGEIVRAPSPEVHDMYEPDFTTIDSKLRKKRRLTASTTGSVFDEEHRPAKAATIVESSDESDMTPEPHAMARSPGLEGVRLCDITPNEAVEQEIYFRLDLERHPEDLVFCLCCGERGHMKSTCSKATCEHCGAKEEHASYGCPNYRKCRLCRQRGHDPSACTNPTSTSRNDPCDICQKIGHVEEECPRLWCTLPQPDPTERVRKIPDEEMIRACYSCGSQFHWGDDCQYSDRALPRSLINTWSKYFANRFVLEHDSVVKLEEDHTSSEKEEEEVKPAPTWLVFNTKSQHI